MPVSSTTYTLIGVSGNGCSATKTISVIVDICSAINRSTNGNERVKLYPNPGSSFVTLETNAPVTASLFDASGQLVFQKKFRALKNTIDVRMLANGAYVLKTSSDTIQQVFKLIKTD